MAKKFLPNGSERPPDSLSLDFFIKILNLLVGIIIDRLQAEHQQYKTTDVGLTSVDVIYRCLGVRRYGES